MAWSIGVILSISGTADVREGLARVLDVDSEEALPIRPIKLELMLEEPAAASESTRGQIRILGTDGPPHAVQTSALLFYLLRRYLESSQGRPGGAGRGV